MDVTLAPLVALIIWLSSGFIGSLLWCWGERMWSTWSVIYATTLGPLGLLFGIGFAGERLRLWKI